MTERYDFKVCGCFLYFTAHCAAGAMHVHASDSRLTEAGSAKFFVRGDGSTGVMEQGRPADRETRIVRELVRDHREEMRPRRSQFGDQGFYGE